MIRLEWKVTHQHTKDFSSEAFASLLERHRIDVDPTDLDAVYNALDSGDWQAEELMKDLASDSNWLDTTDAEIIDLREED